jgi:pimeloyl-ACP methyl ester carboxylesterase
MAAMTYLEAGPAGGPLLFFLHGWPERALMWRPQIDHFAAQGWRCIAPDMRGYGDAPAPDDLDAYALREIVADMTGLHDTLGGGPAVWVGHDWGSPVVWSLAAHHPARCRGVVSLCVPYVSSGFALDHLLPLVDREIYPADRYPDGQWSYYRFYERNFDRAVADFEADVPATLRLLFRPAPPAAPGTPARSASVVAAGGWFGDARRAPALPGAALLSDAELAVVGDDLNAHGFRGPCAWYRNDAANIAYAAEAPDGGRLTMPVLFVHATRDTICETVRSRLADPMRADCADLTEAEVDGGHTLMLERPDEVNEALETWLTSRFAS